MYNIDISVYHWDNDHFEIEDKTLKTLNLEIAKEMQKVLRGLEFSEDDMLCHPSSRYRGKRTHEIPTGYNDRHWIYDRIDVWNGVLIESGFRIYTVVNMIEYISG